MKDNNNLEHTLELVNSTLELEKIKVLDLYL